MLGAILIQAATLGLVFAGVNLYLQPVVLGAIIFLAVFADGIRNRRLTNKLNADPSEGGTILSSASRRTSGS